jgi:hypothetical protein
MSTDSSQGGARPRLFGLGSIALAGLLGGPLAAAYLALTNARIRASRVQVRIVVVFFALATALWIYMLLHVPRDVISQFAVHVPQVLLWWLFCFVLFRGAHAEHAGSGGAFRSVWAALGIALLISVGVRAISLWAHLVAA